MIHSCSLIGDKKLPKHTCMRRSILTCSLKLAISSLYPAGGGERCAAGAPDRCSMATSCTVHSIHTRMLRRARCTRRHVHTKTRAHTHLQAHKHKHASLRTDIVTHLPLKRMCTCVRAGVRAWECLCVCVRARLSLWELACARTSTWA